MRVTKQSRHCLSFSCLTGWRYTASFLYFLGSIKRPPIFKASMTLDLLFSLSILIACYICFLAPPPELPKILLFLQTTLPFLNSCSLCLYLPPNTMPPLTSFKPLLINHLMRGACNGADAVVIRKEMRDK